MTRFSPLAVVAAALSAACTPEVGPAHDWIPAAAIDGPLRPELTQPPVAAPAITRLRAVTFNVHYGENVDALATAIRTTPPLATADLFLLQEIENHPREGSSRTARLAAALGLGHAYVPSRFSGPEAEGGTHGLALLSRYPIDDLKVMELPYVHLPATDGHNRRLAIACTLRLPAGPLPVMNVHLDTRLSLGQRILQLRPALLPSPSRLLLGGDFNTNPYVWAGGGLPVLRPESAADANQSRALADYLQALGFATPTRDAGVTQEALVLHYPLDAFFTRGLTPGQSAVERSVTASDHWPLWLDIDLPPAL